MRYLFTNESDTPIDEHITDVLTEMKTVGVNSDRYPDLMTYLERLHEVKARQRRDSVSPDTLALIAGNLMGILLIVAYEQKHVMTSKGLAQLLRPKSP